MIIWFLPKIIIEERDEKKTLFVKFRRDEKGLNTLQIFLIVENRLLKT